jgi:hypothetical protein
MPVYNLTGFSDEQYMFIIMVAFVVFFLAWMIMKLMEWDHDTT